MNKYFGKLASVALATTIVGGGFGVNASASELESDAVGNTYEIPASALEESINSTDEFKVTVTFVPADGSISTLDQNIQTFVGSKITMNGDYWAISKGQNVVRLEGNVAIMINTGKAVVQAYKSNGSLLGVYYFEVIR